MRCKAVSYNNITFLVGNVMVACGVHYVSTILKYSNIYVKLKYFFDKKLEYFTLLYKEYSKTYVT